MINKLLSLITFIFLIQTLTAQEESTRSDLILGGFINFSTQNNYLPISTLGLGNNGIFSNSVNEFKNTRLGFQPYIGKEFSDKLTVGISLDYNFTNYKSTQQEILFPEINLIDFERKSNQVGLGLFSRYILNPANKLNFYLQPYLGFYFTAVDRFRETVLDQEERARFFTIGIGLGAQYKFSEKLRAVLRPGGIGYLIGSWEILDTELSQNFNAFDATFRLSSASFGIEYSF